MKNTMKRILCALFLIIFLILASHCKLIEMERTNLFMHASALTEGIYTYEVSNNIACIINVEKSASGDIIVPDKIDDYIVAVIGDDAFSGCKKITSVTISNNVTHLGSCAFLNCEKLETVNIGEGITEIYQNTFSRCPNLKTINLKNVTEIHEGAFQFTESLVEIVIPKTFTYSYKYNAPIGKSYGPFTESGIERVILESGIKTIPALTFYYATNLKMVYIPKSVTTFEKSAFFASYNLSDIYYEGTQEEWEKIKKTENYFNSSTSVHYNCKISNDGEITNSVTGEKDGISTQGTVSVNGVWYEYDTSVPGLADAISNIQLGATITCKIRFGKIVSCIASKSAPRVTVSIKTDTTSIAYDCKEEKYSIDKIDDLQVIITNELKSNTKNVAGYDVTFDKIVISTTNTAGVLYFKDGLIDKEREFAMTLDSPVTLKPGDTRTFKIEEPVFVNKDYTWGETETQKEIEISATCFKGEKYLSSDSQKITVENKGAEKNIEQKKELDEGMEQAAGLLEKTTGVLHDDYLEKLLGKDCLQEVTNVLKCKVALSSAVLKAKQNATLEEKLIDKLMKKANISKNWLGTVYTTNITHSVAGETKENGRFTVEFNIELSNISLGSGNNPFVSFSFDTTYEIKGGKKFETREGTVLSYFSYANIQTFADSVESVALEQIEYAYNLGYGNDLNKVCEMFFDDTITKILSKTKAESYSHVFYQSMVYPSKQAAIHCPVDVFVYDTQGNLCASIESNEITLDCEDMDIVVVGDEKYLTLYGEYKIEIVAFANDTMNITITEYASADDVLRTVAFNDLALLPGDSFVAIVSEDYFFDEYQINKNEEEIITADSDESTIHSTQAVEIVDKQATCIEDGAYHVICEKCNMTVLSAVIPATGHADENQDGSCDACGEALEQPETPTDPEEPTDPEVPTEPDVPTDPTTPDEPDVNCSCLCHSKNSFMQLIYTIIRFIWQLFGMNMDCACGAKHFDAYFFG